MSVDLIEPEVTVRARADVPNASGGWPLLGNALQMGKDPAAFFYNAYRNHGAVFQTKMLGNEWLALVGPEAAKFMGSSEGKECLRSEEVWRGVGLEYGAKHTLVAEDGAIHKKLRKVFQPSFAKGAMRGRYDEFVGVTDSQIAENWKVGSEVPVVWAFQRMATHQLGTLNNDFTPDGYEDDIRLAIRNMVTVRVLKMWPEFMTRTPGYMRSKNRFHGMGQKLIDRYHERKANGFEGRRTLVDDTMEMHLNDPELLPESDLIQVVVSPYVAGLDTVASTISCMLYEVLAKPDVLARIHAEVDPLFAKGEVGEEDMTAKAVPTLFMAMMETLRLHPIAPLAMRVANKDFNFEGVPVKEGEMLYIGYTVCHYMEEFFPEPEKFNVDRSPSQYKQPGAFTPYSRGAHTCLGKTLAEVQMLLTMARLFHRLDMSLPEGYTELKKTTFPSPAPNKHFKVQVKGYRQA